jgi:hypothetical protein
MLYFHYRGICLILSLIEQIIFAATFYTSITIKFN